MKKLNINEFTGNEEFMDFASKGELKSYEQELAIIELGKKHAKTQIQ